MSKLVSATRRFPATALLALCAMSCLSGAALAQSSADSGQVRISSSAVYQVTAQEAMSMETPYALSNGQVLVVRQQDRQFFGRLARPRTMQEGQEVELHATAPGRFVSGRGAAFAFEKNGEQVVIDDAQLLPGLRMPAGQGLADTSGNSPDTQTSIRLVSR